MLSIKEFLRECDKVEQRGNYQLHYEYESKFIKVEDCWSDMKLLELAHRLRWFMRIREQLRTRFDLWLAFFSQFLFYHPNRTQPWRFELRCSNRYKLEYDCRTQPKPERKRAGRVLPSEASGADRGSSKREGTCGLARKDVTRNSHSQRSQYAIGAGALKAAGETRSYTRVGDIWVVEHRRHLPSISLRSGAVGVFGCLTDGLRRQQFNPKEDDWTIV